MQKRKNIPLAERMRPNRLDELIGQQHLVGPGQVLRRVVESGQAYSMIFWGPPGSGKTSLARILARELNLTLLPLSAVDAGVREVRMALEQARRLGQAILFIDEIHRFNKGQQDALLGPVERGHVILIGATTENPSLEVIAPLLSRCQVYQLHPLTRDDLLALLHRALHEDEELKSRKIVLQETQALMRLSGGDARKLLNLVEQVVKVSPKDPICIADDLIMQVAQQRTVLHDKDGEQHYNLISAFIKSIRGSDPNAAVYWLARLVAGGEDPLFLCRRMIILASEDIGNADPLALPLAVACYQALERIGMPEGRIVMAQTAIYLACCAKSNSSYLAIEHALQSVQRHGELAVPMHLRNAPTSLMRQWGYGQGYKYDHNHPQHFSGQEFLPEPLQGTRFYDPSLNDKEEELRRFLRQRWNDKYGY
ncbi:MAG: replication-associated recombination protein A [Chitinophagales bacterium]|nr:replication-associated recombination protein A [Chitinophagales bacterium]MDW8427071.1 replication-associated recombination protein A [Chitinophagales bacterium]